MDTIYDRTVAGRKARMKAEGMKKSRTEDRGASKDQGWGMGDEG
jgi:hypothetical protein